MSWLEALDPCHRFLTTHYLQWQKENLNTPFFLWLENQVILYTATQVEFLDDVELYKHQVEIEAGFFVSSLTKKKINHKKKNQEYIFVINLDKKLIIIQGSDGIRHSSISRGKPVLGAGALKITNGKLVYIDTESGHYQPSAAALRQIIELLYKQGAYMDYNVLQVKYYDNGQIIQEKASLFMKKHKNSFPSKLSVEFIERLKKFKI